MAQLFVYMYRRIQAAADLWPGIKSEMKGEFARAHICAVDPEGLEFMRTYMQCGPHSVHVHLHML